MIELRIQAQTPEIEQRYMAMLADNPKMACLENSGFDLMTIEDVTLELSKNALLVSTGIALKLPTGYHAEVVMRSSTYKKYGIMLTNNIGIIDNSYCGKDDIIKMQIIKVGVTSEIRIPRFTRIGQLLIRKTEPAKIYFVSNFEDNNRGGFGSTGN